jgi:hypothetical protein
LCAVYIEDLMNYAFTVKTSKKRFFIKRIKCITYNCEPYFKIYKNEKVKSKVVLVPNLLTATP